MFTFITVLALIGLWLALSFNRFRMRRTAAAGAAVRGERTAAGTPGEAAVAETCPTFRAVLRVYLRWLVQSLRDFAKGPTLMAWSARIKAFGLWELPFIEKWLLIVLYATFLYLAASGFFWAIFIRRGLYGVPLLLHFTAGVIFAICLALTAILRARRYTLDPRPLHLPATKKGLALVRDAKRVWKIRLSTKDVTSLLFWLFLLAGLSLAVSALFPMMPWFHYKGQILLFGWHRWSALVSLLAAIAFADLEFFASRPQT